MGYGQISVLKEYGPGKFPNKGGNVRWSARFGADNLVQSYRGYKQVWKGIPATEPDLVVVKGGSGCNTAYVSWNGATEVVAWIVFEGSSQSQLSRVGQVPFKGFETSFGTGAAYVQVQPLNKDGSKGQVSAVVKA